MTILYVHVNIIKMLNCFANQDAHVHIKQ